MRLSKTLQPFLLTLSLVFAASCVTYADPATSESGQTVTVAPEKETETEKPAQPELAVKKSGSQYYLYDKTTNKTITGKKGRVEYPAGSKDYYYFINTKGRIYVKKFFTKNNKKYYADNTGKLASGLVTIKKKTYYFLPSTNAMKTGWVKISEKQKGYFNAGGVQQFGFQKIGDYTYYLDPSNQGIRSIGWTKISGKWYYFNSKGRMQTGLVTVDGKKYYLANNGIRKTGLVTIDGSKYYFDSKNGGAMATGWISTKKYTYYFSQTGKAVSGWLSLSGKKYYFNAKCRLVKKWMTLDGNKYYLDDNDGHMLTGKQTIDGKTYDFGTKGYIVVEVTGTWSIKVNQGTCVVTIYRGDTPIKAMLCSVGLNGATPNGTFSLGAKKAVWHPLFGNVYGQYATTINGNILFHSVYYYTSGNPNTLSTAEYNKLGSPASAGCVRLSCENAYYIWSKVPVGTKVTIFNGTTKDDPLPRPAKLTITTNYDPTDPIKND